MKNIGLSLTACSVLWFAPGIAQAQLHGTHEPSERAREPGIRPDSLESVFVGAAEKYHKLQAWKEHEAAEFELTLTLNDDDPIEVTATFAVEGNAFALSMEGQRLLGHDGETAWETAKLKESGEAEVHLRMLGQLPVLPYRFRDGQHILIGRPIRMVNERRYHVMSRQPVERDDWSILFLEPHTNLLRMVAYFIRTSDDDEPAFSPAYAMVADEYEKKDDVPFPRQWHIWRWSRVRGLDSDEAIGSVRVTGIEFIDPCDDAFASPQSEPDVDDNAEDA